MSSIHIYLNKKGKNMLYILGIIIGFVVGFVVANFSKGKAIIKLNAAINDLERKLTLSRTRRLSKHYRRNGKKKTGQKKVVVNKKANVGGKRKAKKA